MSIGTLYILKNINGFFFLFRSFGEHILLANLTTFLEYPHNFLDDFSDAKKHIVQFVKQAK